MRHSVDYLYSLYDALVSINVPNDKARAVVDAMERDMSMTITSKSDLQLLKQELASAIARLASRDEMLAFKAEVKADIAELRQAIALIHKDMEILSTSVHKDMEILSTSMTVRLGSLQIVGLSVLFAALKFT